MMLPLIEMVLFLQKVPIFKDLSIEELGNIAGITHIENYEEGEILFHEGDIGDQAFVVVSGKVEIYKESKRNRQESIITVFQSGDCFGEMSLFDGQTRSTSARTVEPTALGIYSKSDLNLVIDRYPSIAIGIIKVLSNRLRNITVKQNKYSNAFNEFKKVYQNITQIDEEDKE